MSEWVSVSLIPFNLSLNSDRSFCFHKRLPDDRLNMFNDLRESLAHKNGLILIFNQIVSS